MKKKLLLLHIYGKGLGHKSMSPKKLKWGLLTYIP